MMNQTIVITGSSGFIGSALCVEMSRKNRVYGLDQRPPSEQLRQAAPEARWMEVEISNTVHLQKAAALIMSENASIDFVIHLAAFYHYGIDWREGYDDTNIEGTLNVMDTFCGQKLKRFIFASSIASLPPPPEGVVLTESSEPKVHVPYGKSKAVGEWLLSDIVHRMPVVILRIGGVFSDWCELPPLYSLINIWSKRDPLGRCIPGKGKSGFPYIHRNELIRLICRIIDRNADLNRMETLFGSEENCTHHKDLYPIIRKECGRKLSRRPIHIAPALTWCVLKGKYGFNRAMGRPSYERAWMAAYIDRPLRIDASRTRQKLRWKPNPELSICQQIPVLIRNFRENRQLWEVRNTCRNIGRHQYYST
jgi:nucleoside-diphosphate-sugar epimerase